MRESEIILKRLAKELDVPVTDVPKIVKNLLNDVAELDKQLTQ